MKKLGAKDFNLKFSFQIIKFSFLKYIFIIPYSGIFDTMKKLPSKVFAPYGSLRETELRKTLMKTFLSPGRRNSSHSYPAWAGSLVNH